MFTAVAAMIAGGSAGLRGQEHPAAPPSLSGTWTLDPYVSDHPEQVARVLQLATGGERGQQRRDESARGGSYGGGGGGFGGFGRSGGRSRGRVPPPDSGNGSREALSDTDKQVLDELTGAVRFAPARLVIAQTPTAVTITGDDRMPVTLTTNGHGEKQTVGNGSVDRHAMWEGPQLLVAYDIGNAGTLSYRYDKAPTTGQLVVRVAFERKSGATSPLEVKLVYDPPAH